MSEEDESYVYAREEHLDIDESKQISLSRIKIYPIIRGPKGKLSTVHDNPRIKKEKSPLLEFEESVGGEEAAERLLDQYKRMDTTERQDTFITSMFLQYPVTDRVVKNVFKIGSSRLERLKNSRTKRKPGGLNGSEVTDSMVADLRDFVGSILVEDGYPCHHRRMKLYASSEEFSSWKDFHAKYVKFSSERKMAYTTLRRYMPALHPDFALTRAKEDECDTCIRYKLALESTETPEGDKATIKAAQLLHWDEARIQRRVMREAIKKWGCENLTQEPASTAFDDAVERLGEFVDDNLSIVNSADGRSSILLHAEDYGGNLFLPWYGHSRPSIDYFTSNLNMYFFVIASLSWFVHGNLFSL